MATLDPAALVHGWRSDPGARATGCGRWASTAASRLQDLFTDRRVPRSLRHELPVVAVGGEVAWVAGVAVSEEFRLARGRTGEAAVLSASRVDDSASPRTSAGSATASDR